MNFIDLKAQYSRIESDVDARIKAVLAHGQYILGPEVGELEGRLADFVGAKHCISVSSGTDALLVALMALGVGAGDEVITTPFTFVATAEVIVLLGARPVFVDIDPVTYNIDPALIEAAITPRTKVIMPVSLYGQCADMDEIDALAEVHGIPVVEDAAQSFGAEYKGRRSGGLSTIGATSFFPSKPLGCYGDGGACFTDDDDLAKAMREVRLHGQDKRYSHPRLGINGRFDTIQAAILLAKLPLFDGELVARARIGGEYSERLVAGGGRPTGEAETGLLVPSVLAHNTSVYAQYTLQVEDRERVLAGLQERGIPTAVHYPIPLNRQGAYANLCGGQETPVSERCAQRVFSLPMHPYLGSDDMDRVVEAVLAVVFG